jgi:adenylate kinase
MTRDRHDQHQQATELLYHLVRDPYLDSAEAQASMAELEASQILAGSDSTAGEATLHLADAQQPPADPWAAGSRSGSPTAWASERASGTWMPPGTPMRLVVIGPPGAGKGTQTEFIGAHLAVPKISTGDIFRANVAQGTPLGVQAKRYMNAGQLVPDEITINMVRDRLAETDAVDGFLLDGFPRSVPQAAELDKLLADIGTGLDLVLELVVDDDEVIRRLSGRRMCRGCGAIWHVSFCIPREDGLCDRCGGRLFERDDDKAEIVAERLKVYARDTAPLVDYYGAQGKLVGIDAAGPVDDVSVRAIDAIRPYAC